MTQPTQTEIGDPGRSAPGVLRRYFSIYIALWKNSVTREMIFKSNFLLWIVVEIL